MKDKLTLGFEAKRIFKNKTGLGNYSRDLVRILSAFYPENTYLLYNPKANNQKLFIPNNTNVFEKNPRHFFSKIFYNVWRQQTVVHDISKDGVVIFHGLSGEIPSGLKQKNIKIVVTIHDLIFLRYPQFYSFFDRKIHKLKFKKAIHQADKIIAISEQTKKDIIHFFNVPESKIEVIYQGCQPVFKQRFSQIEKDIVSKKYNLPQKFILNVGTIEARKNVLSVVKAIKNIENIDLVIIGNKTKYTQKVMDYITENQLQNRVHFLTGLNSIELATVYQLAKIFVYPSLFEGFGIPIIEALYSGTPVITNNSGVFPEAAGPAGAYVNPENSEEIANKIIELLENEALCTKMIEEGNTFVQKFNDETIAQKVMAMYQKLQE
jgi:glycosyltransferase involved in cell wall biosynthesis